MHVVVRKVPGGYRARLSNNTKFGKVGASRAEAIGHLVILSLRTYGISSIRWDKKDERTCHYIAGKPFRINRPPQIITKYLPRVSSTDEAQLLRINDDLAKALPARLRKALTGHACFGYGLDPSLGQICARTAKNLAEKASTSNPIGPKTIAWIVQLLKHYGLSLRP